MLVSRQQNSFELGDLEGLMELVHDYLLEVNAIESETKKICGHEVKRGRMVHINELKPRKEVQAYFDESEAESECYSYYGEAGTLFSTDKNSKTMSISDKYISKEKV